MIERIEGTGKLEKWEQPDGQHDVNYDFTIPTGCVNAARSRNSEIYGRNSLPGRGLSPFLRKRNLESKKFGDGHVDY